MRTMIVAATLLSLLSTSAMAHRRHHHHHHHPVVATTTMPALSKIGSGRPSDCPSRWCACWLTKMLARMGYSTHNTSNLARAYAAYGTTASPGSTGSIMVMKSHVGVVVGQCDSKSVRLLSGNHNGRVGVGCYPMSRAIAWRRPTAGYMTGIVVPAAAIAPTVRRNFNR